MCCFSPAEGLILFRRRSPQGAGEVAFITTWPEIITGNGRKEGGTTYGGNIRKPEMVHSHQGCRGCARAKLYVGEPSRANNEHAAPRFEALNTYKQPHLKRQCAPLCVHLCGALKTLDGFLAGPSNWLTSGIPFEKQQQIALELSWIEIPLKNKTEVGEAE